MNKIAYDTEWFETYLNKCSFDDISFIKFEQENLEEQRQKFFTGKTDEPVLLYQDFREQVADHRRGLEDFREMIEKDKDQLFAVRQIYYRKIVKQLDRVTLLEAMNLADDERFMETSLKLYGELDKVLMQKALATLLLAAKRNGYVLSEYLKELAAYFSASPDNSVFDHEPIDENAEMLSADGIAEIFKEDLREKEIPWQVRICGEALVVHVNYTEKTIIIPAFRTMTKVEVKALVEHEVNVHLLRYINGANSSLRLLSIGLDGYIKGEEGITTYRQCLIDKSLPSVDTYIGIGLASGLYEGRPRSFREVFNFFKEYFRMINKSESEIDNLAWKKTLRLFRGTTGKTGACFTRGTIYFEGFVKIKEMIEVGHPEVDRFLVGKYDPTNEFHISILDELRVR